MQFFAAMRFLAQYCVGHDRTHQRCGSAALRLLILFVCGASSTSRDQVLRARRPSYEQHHCRDDANRDHERQHRH
jgi:hypothetical protein